jgi:death-on-curing protein
MRSEPYWLTEKEALAIHNDLIHEFSGSLGILNPGALQSTLARPRNLFYYNPEAALSDLAACYGYGFVKNHCFIDGNKRTALDVIDVFLQRNGYELIASEVEAVEVMVGLAVGEIDQDALAKWIEANLSSL